MSITLRIQLEKNTHTQCLTYGAERSKGIRLKLRQITLNNEDVSISSATHFIDR